MSLSIVFPAYDEEKKISHDILRVSEFLKTNQLDGEIIVVDDGSKDGTYERAIELKSIVECDLNIIKHAHNLGKGFAVRSGILAAKHELILYSDVGDIVPLKSIFDGIEQLRGEDADIAHGSRKLPDSKIIKEQDSDRRIVSWLFNTFFKKFLNVPKELTDTQCGFKLYKNEVGKSLFSQLQTKGFLYEIEIILRARKDDRKIVEFPLEWKCDRDSRIKIWRTTPEVLKEILKIKKMFS